MTAKDDNKLNLPAHKQAMRNFKDKPWLRVFVVIIALLAVYLLFANQANAAGAGVSTLNDSFETMWDEVKSLMTGYPAKILMGFAVLGVLAFTIVKPNLIGFGASIITLLVMANAADVIDDSMTATVHDVAVSVGAQADHPIAAIPDVIDAK